MKFPPGVISVTVTVTLPIARFVEEADPFAVNLSEPLAEAALRKSKIPMPAPMLTEPLFSFELFRDAVVVVFSLMMIVTISPTLVAR